MFFFYLSNYEKKDKKVVANYTTGGGIILLYKSREELIIMKVSKQKRVVLFVVGVALVLAIATFTYAIWSKTHTQTGVNKNTYACFEIAYKETNGEGITMNNGYPQKDEQGMQNEPYEVEIKNTCNTVSTYNVILNKQTGSNLDDTHLKVAVDNDYKLLSDATPTDKRTIEGFQNEKSYIIGTGVVGPNQTKIVQIRSWMDEKTTETEGENKSFTFKITIEAVAGIGEGEFPAKDMILASQTVTPEAEMSHGYDYYQVTKSNQDVSIVLDDSNTMCVTDDFSNFNGALSSMCYDGSFDENNCTCEITDPSSYTGYYTFGNNSDYLGSGTVYKIVEANSTTITKADIISLEGYDVPTGIVEATDDDGTSYVYRGEIKNNYIKFADKLWRIVRINGDGSIRLILNDKDTGLSNMGFNSTYNNPKFVGYTYDNKQSCTSDNPCISDYNGSGWTNSANMGTNSTIKGKLEDWYNTNLKAYDNKIALTKYCNDTTTGHTASSYTYYGAYDRLESNEASLHCPDTEKDYGGLYKLKIGLLSADEMVIAGLPWLSETTSSHYLYHNYWWWSMSPYYSYSSYADEFGGSYGNVYYNYVNSTNGVLPVINLNADTLITSGDGSQNNPFIVG